MVVSAVPGSNSCQPVFLRPFECCMLGDVVLLLALSVVDVKETVLIHSGRRFKPTQPNSTNEFWFAM